MISTAFVFTLIAGSQAMPTAEDQAFLALLAETKVGRMAGMPVMDVKSLPPGIKLPPEAMMFMGTAARILNIRLWSPSIAPPAATASIAPPAGLKQGPMLELELFRPTGSEATEKIKDFDPDSNPEFTIKIYWGSSETVREGQPKIITWAGMPDDQKAAMRQKVRESQATSSYFYKPNWTTGYWPTRKQAGNIADDASLVGKFSLTTNYTGNVDIEAPSNVNFLAPYALTSPDLERRIDLKKFVAFNWPPISNLLGQNVSAIGMEGKNTLIMWSASEVFTETMMGDQGFLQMAEVRDFVSKTIFLPGDATKATIPAGIFQNADFAMTNLAGYGPGAALDKAQPLPRIQTKTTMMVMLGGKKMR